MTGSSKAPETSSIQLGSSSDGALPLVAVRKHDARAVPLRRDVRRPSLGAEVEEQAIGVRGEGRVDPPLRGSALAQAARAPWRAILPDDHHGPPGLVVDLPCAARVLRVAVVSLQPNLLIL